MMCNSYFLTLLSLSIQFYANLCNLHCKNKTSERVPLVLISMESDYYSLFLENATASDPDATAIFVGVCDLKTLQKWSPCPFNDSPNCCPHDCKIQRKQYDINSIADQPQCNCNGSQENRQLQDIPDFPTCFLGGQCINPKCTIASRSVRKLPSIIYECILNKVKRRNARTDLRLRRQVFSGTNRMERAERINQLEGMQYQSKCMDNLGICRNIYCSRGSEKCCPPGHECKRLNRGTMYVSPDKYLNELGLEHESNNVLTRILRAVSSDGRLPSEIYEVRNQKRMGNT